jgi:hypothetical protein
LNSAQDFFFSFFFNSNRSKVINFPAALPRHGPCHMTSYLRNYFLINSNFYISKLWFLDNDEFDMSNPTYLTLIGIAEQFRSRSSIGLSLECLSAAALLESITPSEKATANLLIGKTLAQYAKNKGMSINHFRIHIFFKYRRKLFLSFIFFSKLKTIIQFTTKM